MPPTDVATEIKTSTLMAAMQQIMGIDRTNQKLIFLTENWMRKKKM